MHTELRPYPEVLNVILQHADPPKVKENVILFLLIQTVYPASTSHEPSLADVFFLHKCRECEQSTKQY